MYFSEKKDSSNVLGSDLQITYVTAARNNTFISRPTFDLLSKNGKLPHEFLPEYSLDIDENIKLFRDHGYSDQIVYEHIFLNEYLRSINETAADLMSYLCATNTSDRQEVPYELVTVNKHSYVVLGIGFLTYVKENKNNLLTFLKDVMYQFEHVHDRQLTYKRSIRYAEILSVNIGPQSDLDFLNLITDFV